MQKEITKPGKLFDEGGRIGQTGWARKPVITWNRENVPGSRLFIKEWDYYYVTNGDSGLSLTIADNGYMAFYAMTLFDFTVPAEVSESIIRPFSMGKLNMPSSSLTGDCVVRDKKIDISFTTEDNRKILKVDCPGFGSGAGLKGEIILYRDPDNDSISVVTPFHKPGKFYFNEKVNCMAAEGRVETGGKTITFEKSDSMGVLDWGRGVWTYENTWYWGSASGRIAGVPFGFNIGYGFGDTSSATENILFYNGRGHKLEDVKFHIPGEPEGDERYMDPWTFTSSDGRFEMDFLPVLDRSSEIALGILKSRQHQVFGKFSGKAVLDEGTVLEVKDFHGFAEKVYNRW